MNHRKGHEGASNYTHGMVIEYEGVKHSKDGSNPLHVVHISMQAIGKSAYMELNKNLYIQTFHATHIAELDASLPPFR